MNNAKSSKIAALLAATIILLVSACGGGGGGTGGDNGFTPGVNTNTKPQISSVDDIKSASSSSKTSSSILSSSKSSISKSSSSTPKITIDIAAPTSVSEFQVTFTEYDIVVLHWTAATDNVGVTAYKIYRNQIQIDQVDAADINYADFNVAPDSSYTYSVSAGDATGNWSAVKSILAKTLAAPIPPSSASSSLSSKSASSASSSLSSTNSNSASSKSNNSSSSSSKSASSTSSASSSPDITAPSAPGSVSQILVSAYRVDIGWTTATDNVAVTAYRIYRDNILLSTLGAGTLEYSDKTSAPNKVYTYGVEAGDAAGNWSPTRKTIVITTPAANANGDVTLYWAPPTQREDGSSITTAELGGFLIRYKPKADTNYTFIDIKDGSAKSNIIANLNGDYDFQIATYDSNNLYSTFATLSPK